ncbi:MAG: response regulator [Deltaproteobacteria bacterium]|nr:response regulator [Deltaproteobacteria bacterium]
MLIVDDEASHRELLSFLLCEEYDVMTAQDGPEALAKAAAKRPDVVLADYRMPGMSGVEVLRELRDLCPDSIRFLVTAYADTDVLRDSINLGGIYRFLSKPVDSDILRVDIARALEHRADRVGRERAEKLAVLGRIAGSVIHDINNALTVIGFIADALEEVSTDPLEVQRSAGELRVVDRGMRDLVAELMALVKNTTPVFALDSVRIEDIVRSTVKLECRTDLYVRRTVDIEVSDAVPPVLASRSRVQRLVTNLLRNAVAATQDGGRILVRVASDAEGAVYIEVRDDGSGISPELQARIFDPFFTTKGAEGAGLGLSICAAVMRGHGGALRCESRPGEGTSFVASFPVVRQ